MRPASRRRADRRPTAPAPPPLSANPSHPHCSPHARPLTSRRDGGPGCLVLRRSTLSRPGLGAAPAPRLHALLDLRKEHAALLLIGIGPGDQRDAVFGLAR